MELDKIKIIAGMCFQWSTPKRMTSGALVASTDRTQALALWTQYLPSWILTARNKLPLGDTNQFNNKCTLMAALLLSRRTIHLTTFESISTARLNLNILNQVSSLSQLKFRHKIWIKLRIVFIHVEISLTNKTIKTSKHKTTSSHKTTTSTLASKKALR